MKTTGGHEGHTGGAFARPLLPAAAARAATEVLFYGAIAALAFAAWLTVRWSVAYIAFPYESIDPVEGLLLEQAVRLGRGETIYPDADATAAISCPYPPLYQALCAPFIKAYGPGLFWMRLVPGAATLVVALLLLVAVRSAGCGWGRAAMCAFLWLALNGAVDGFFVRARVDMPFMAFGVAALILYRRADRSTPALVAALILTGLATFTKQNGWFFAVSGLGYVALRGRWRRATLAGAAWVAAMLVPTLWMQARTEGRFLSDLAPAGLWAPVAGNADRLQEFCGTAGPLLAAGAVWLVHGLLRDRRSLVSPFALALVLFTPFGMLHQLSEGGGENAHLPMLAALLLVLGTWTAPRPRTAPAVSGGHGAEAAGPAPAAPAAVSSSGMQRALLGAVVLVQAACLPVITQTPTEADWAAGQKIDQFIRDRPEPILMSAFQSYLVRAGRPVYDDFISAHDRYVVGRWNPARTVHDIEQRKYRYILTDGRVDPKPVREALLRAYKPVGQLPLPQYVRRRPPLVVFEPRP